MKVIFITLRQGNRRLSYNLKRKQKVQLTFRRNANLPVKPENDITETITI